MPRPELRARNPRTGALDYAFVPASAEDVAAAADRLRRAQPAWRDLGVEGRADALRAWQAALVRRQRDLHDALAVDTGRGFLARLEIQGVYGMIGRWTAEAPALLRPAAPSASAALPSVRLEQQLVPYPVVGVIGPWNFPLTLALIDAIPALLAGCTVLLKPSEVTPRFVRPLAEALAEVPPLAEALAVLEGDAETGRAVVAHADAVCFTGSVATGRRVAAATAERLVPAFLELGGKDPAIVLADANLDAAADAILRSGCGAAGQACQSIERVYVQSSVFDDFVERLVARARAATLSTDGASGQIGPVIFAPQAETLRAHLADAVARGATVHTGGEVEEVGGGLWCRPTVLTGVTPEMRVMTEETFGPLLPVVPFDTLDEAVALANGTEFGLSAAVFTADLDAARALAARLDAGAVSVNDAGLTTLVYDAEKHAFKASGLGGSRMGAAGLLRFVRKRALLIQTGAPAPLASHDETHLAAFPA